MAVLVSYQSQGLLAFRSNVLEASEVQEEEHTYDRIHGDGFGKIAKQTMGTLSRSINELSKAIKIIDHLLTIHLFGEKQFQLPDC